MKDIKGYEGLYAITRDGRVWSYPRKKGMKGFKVGHWMKPNQTADGYNKYPLYRDGNQRYFSGHRLVAVAYIDNENNLKEVNHKNGIKTDNRIENLEWCTRSENLIHAYRIGLRVQLRGEQNSNSKLTTEDVLKIRCLYRNTKLFCREIADQFEVDESTVVRIVSKKTWKYI